MRIHGTSSADAVCHKPLSLAEQGLKGKSRTSFLSMFRPRARCSDTLTMHALDQREEAQPPATSGWDL